MPWRYDGIDSKVEVIVDPSFRGDLIALATRRPVWIVDTPDNKPLIDATWSVGKDASLCEVSRYPVRDASDRKGNLLMMLGDLDDHQGTYDLVVHGLQPNADLTRELQDEGFVVAETLSDGFEASRIPGVRERLIGRLG